MEVVGLDRDPEMLAAARSKAPGARFVEGEVTRLPFADRAFELTLAVTVFCFLASGERVLAARELVRVTRPGGRVVIGELAPFQPMGAEAPPAGMGRVADVALCPAHDQDRAGDAARRRRRGAGGWALRPLPSLDRPPGRDIAGAAGTFRRHGRRPSPGDLPVRARQPRGGRLVRSSGGRVAVGGGFGPA
ncbi:MAG: hypothetical protein C4306_09415 [Thermoleophilia bacterium]